MPGIETARIQTFCTEILEAPLPELSHEGIRWSGGAAGRPLEVAIDFRNPGHTFSQPASARIDIAPFGAFVPGELLATAAVPSLPPGGAWTFRTAVASDDLPSWAARGTSPPATPPRWERPSVDPAIETRKGALWSWKAMPTPDTAEDGGTRGRSRLRWRSLLRSDTHFVGNLNVFVSARRPVERHMARAVKLMAGKPNLGMFSIGDKRQAEYRFHPDVCEAGWSMEIQPYPWDTPVPITRGHAVVIIVPPAKAESGRAAIRVDRVSTGESALVEFELDVRAGGSKCWFF
jgi:hypothetical protein